MLDQFAIDVVNRLKDVASLEEAKTIGHEILDEGDFQGNIPELKEAVDAAESIDQVQLIMWRTASSGLEKKARYS